ncbi:MAG: IS1595 family transposase [Chitinophagaceae bacterium]|nr:IS1595 family transposase [Chitinophagaceae bacterium]
MFTFKSLQEFNDFFKDEKACYDFLSAQRWKDGISCPHCGSEKIYVVKTRSANPELKDINSYRCGNRECDMPFTCKVGTIFEGCKIPLRKFFQAIYEITTSKKGISSVELATRLSITQKSAWFVGHRVRAMLREIDPLLLDGVVEIDETYIGGKEKNKSKKARAANKEAARVDGKNRHVNAIDTKIPVIGILERGGKVRAQTITNTGFDILAPMLSENVSPNAVIVTDGWKPYKKIGANYKDHVVVNHAQDEWTRGEFSTNSIEGFFSILKRGIIGIYHYVSPKHLHRYCTEFTARYNERKSTNIDRFVLAVNQSEGARLTYAELIKNLPGKEEFLFRM